MREGLGVCLLAAVAWWGVSAPVPKARPKPVPAFPSGGWRVTWGSTPCVMRFAAGGGYECDWCGGLWRGSWSYCPERRTLGVSERSPSGEPFAWELRVAADGTAAAWQPGGGPLAAVTMERLP